MGGDAIVDLNSPLLSPSTGTTVSDERLGIDDMLQRYAGEFGRWQLRHFVLVSMAWALEAFHTMVMIFADQEPDGHGGAKKPPSSDWLGGRDVSSTVAEWGLVGDQRYKIGLVQSIFFLGCMIGSGVFGHLSDSFLGRKGSLIVVCVLNTVFGFLTAVSPDYWVYAALRFLTGFNTGGVGLCAFVLATEPVGPSMRGVAGMSTFYFFSGGIALLAGVAYLFRSWRVLYVITSVPSLLFVVAVLPLVSESPRWYLVRRRTADAMAVMQSIAKKNGKQIPHGITLKLDDENEESEATTIKNGQGGVERVIMSGSVVDLLRSPITRVRLFGSVAINFLCSVVYYGLSLNVVNLDTNIYLSVLLNAVAEIPAYIVTALLLDRFGRKPLAIGTMWFSGVFCVIGSLVGNVGVLKVVRMISGVIGIFGMAATYNLLFIYTIELFPTVVRNAALGCTTQAAQMGAILAPLVVVIGGAVPFAVFGACGSSTPTTNRMDSMGGGAAADLHSPFLSPSQGTAVSDERLGIDDMLQRHTGEFGRWQLRHFVLVSMAWALEAFHTMVMIFADQEPNGYGDAAEPPSSDWLGGGDASTITEWGLVGDQRYKIGLAQSIFFLGCMIGSGVFGHLSDSFLGRKGSLIVVCVLNTIFGLLTAVSPDYWVYAALRFLTGFSTGGVGLCAFVLATEPVGPSMRGVAGMSTFYFFSGGIAFLAGIAYLFRSWRVLYVMTSLPSLLFVVAVLPLVSESPRWYLVRRRTADAMAVMQSIAKKNGKQISQGITLKLDDENEEEEVTTIKNGQGGVEKVIASGSIVDVLRSRTTRVRLFVSVAINFLCSVVYYGLSLNVVNLETNIYLSVLLNAVAEMPAYFLTALLLDRFGRKPLAIGTMWFSGVFCVIGCLVGNVGVLKVCHLQCSELVG
ncbi:hypothetical protein Cni_G14146 [Canna indica]|uniref:H(+)/Pi cotransporter n=1 Tax=Canna indica TaxID=4628 RepID=A0AAQ3KFS2_9LILI|nr:hypothetical protein Cni_G14146 [Canna indica]